MSFETDSKTVPAPYQNDPRIERDSNGVWHVRGYSEARDLLKDELIQEGFNAKALCKAGFDGVLYMHGEPHRQMRAAIAKYFSPATVQNAHITLIQKLLKVPGIRIESGPDIKRNDTVEGHEVNHLVVKVD